MEKKMFPKIIPELCKGCGICIHICPKKALRWSEDFNSYGVHYPILDENKCIKCYLCARYCPDFAILAPTEKR